MSVTVGTGALLALERGDTRVVALLDLVQRAGGTVHVPAGVVAQAWRGGRQARVARVLAADRTTVVPLDGPAARAVGLLLAATGTSDVVDAHVALVAAATRTAVVTSDPGDLRRLDPGLPLHQV